jgi:hypothetical protein
MSSASAFTRAVLSIRPSPIRPKNDRQKRSRFLADKFLSGTHHLSRHPIRKSSSVNFVLSCSSVNFPNCRKPISIESFGKSHQRWPQAAMDIGHFAADKAAHEHIG